MAKSTRFNFRRTARKVARAVGRSIKKRYVSRRGGLKVSRIAKDVAMLKTMVNAEKEVYTAHNITNTAIAPGTPYIAAITNITEGASAGQRDGQSVKLHGFRWSIRANQQTNLEGPQYFKLWLVKYVGPRGTTPSINTFLKADFDGNRSYNSQREEDHYSSYRVVAHIKGRIGQDSISGQNMYTLKNSYGRFRAPAHQRYSGTAETTLLTDQMYIIGVCSAGTVAGTSGMLLDSQLQISFYDN